MKRETHSHQLEITLIGSFFPLGLKNAGQFAQPAQNAPFDEDDFLRNNFDLQPNQVSRAHIQEGQASISLVLYSVEDKSFMVRKRVKKEKEGEIAFMKALQEPYCVTRQALQIQWSLPRVFHVVEHEAYSDIYMQFVDGVTFRSCKNSGALAPALAKAIYGLSVTLPIVCRTGGIEPEHRGNPGSAFFMGAERLEPGLAPRLQAIARLQRQLPLVMSHNDIFWPNLGITGADDAPQFTFIDFGMLGQNVIGAELHHFARMASASPKNEAFFVRICRHFATHAHMDRRVIEMNARFYAAMRLMAFDKTTNKNADTIRALCLAAVQNFNDITAG